MSNSILAIHIPPQTSEFPWSALITAGAVVLTTIFTLWFTNLREAGRQQHERELHRDDLKDRQEARREQGEEQRFAKLREERLKAYADLNRMATTFDPNEYAMTDLKEALSQIELLTDDERVLDTANALVGKTNKTRQLVRELKKTNLDADPAQDLRVQEAVRETEQHRAVFVAEVKRELKYKPPMRAQRALRALVE